MRGIASQVQRGARSMADRLRDRSLDDRSDRDPSDTALKRPEQEPVDAAEPASTERRKAENEIAAGDVADDLADFA